MKNASLPDAEFLERGALDAELTRVFEKCQDCRRCLPLCPSFPSLFKSIDRLDPGKTAIYRVYVLGTTPGKQRIRTRVVSDSISQPLISEEATEFQAE